MAYHEIKENDTNPALKEVQTINSQKVSAAAQEGRSSTAQGSQPVTTADDDNEDVNFPWELIESDPVIFTDMIKRYGVEGVVVQDVFTLESLTDFAKTSTYGIILAYQYIEDESPQDSEEHDNDADNIVFSRQVVVNSCATQSLVNTLTNLDIEKGELIQGFIDSTDKIDSTNRGITLGKVKEFREIHNSYGNTYPLDTVPKKKGCKSRKIETYVTEDIYHFVSYIPKNGFLWELDSMKKNPVKLMVIKEDENWLALLKSILTEKIESDPLNATLLAVVKDPIIEKEQQLKSLVAYIKDLTDNITKEALVLDKPGTSSSANGPSLTSKDVQLQEEKNNLEELVKQLQEDISSSRKEDAEKLSNIKRFKEVFFPAIFNMATAAVKSGTDLQKYQYPLETQVTKGKGRSTPIAPRGKRGITRASVLKYAKAQTGKQTATIKVASARGRGRGRRGRGRGKASTTVKAQTQQPKGNTSESEKKTKSKRKRQHEDDDEAETVRKLNAKKRYNLRK